MRIVQAPLAGALVASVLCAAATPARASSFTKTIDRRFPASTYCPIDNASFDLTFTAETSRVRIKIQMPNLDGSSNWLEQRLDNMSIEPKSVFDAHRLVTPGFTECYI